MEDDRYVYIDDKSVWLRYDKARGEWSGSYEGGVLTVSKKADLTVSTNAPATAMFKTTSGALIAEAGGSDPESAVQNLEAKIVEEVDRLRLLLRLSTR